MVSVRDVTYWYHEGGPAALRNVNLEIARGESVCVMGRNGSGKSTLARLIAGLAEPDRGQIAVNGEKPEPGSSHHGAGILFQNPDNQMVATLVEKEIAFALENQAMLFDLMKPIVEGAMERFGISHLRNRLTSELSGGEKQRVALVSVMVQNPPVLVLDEPDAFLDESGRRLLEEELARLRRDNPELVEIRITQSSSAARTYSRVIVFEGGSIIADGPPSEALPRYENTYKDVDNTDLAILPQRSASGIVRIELERASFSYAGGNGGISDVSLSLNSGETVGLVGPTGVGKSSLGLILCGILKPNDGRLQFVDRQTQTIPSSALRGRVAAVLQQPERQFFLPTCREEVSFGPANIGRKLSDEDVDAFLNLVGLPTRDFRDRDPFSLSAGEKRRLAFAGVLSMSPSMIIFDEPTAGLDSAGEARFVKIVKGLKAAGAGQLIITHSGDLIEKIADRVLYLKRSDCLLELSPGELLNNTTYAGAVTKTV